MNISLGKMFGVIAGLLPLIYIGWLLRHFIGVGGGTAEGIAFIGLGPTVIGLSLVGLLFALPLLVKLLRVATGANRAPGKKAETMLKPGEAAGEPPFDADAVFADYMRKRSKSDDLPAGEALSSFVSDDDRLPPARSAGFGRKGLG